VHTLFSCSLFRICLKQYNLEFCSSVGNIASFQMIYIIDLFDRFLLLFYKVNYRSLKHVHNLIHGAIYRKWEQYYSFGFCGSVDKEYRLSNDVTHAHKRMTSLCLPCLERTQIFITQQAKQSSSLLLSWSRQVHICQEMILREFLKKLCQIVKAVYLTQTMPLVQLKIWALAKQSFAGRG
jgi:hypothetical protein